jgi:hypothetical protein
MTKKAKSKSKAKAKRVFAFEKRTPEFYKKMLKNIGDIESSGELIRARVVEGKMTPDQIVAEVKKRFKGSTTKRSDVYWNRARLKAEGIKLPKPAPKKEQK